MRSITEDILQWSEFYLEPKNEHLGDVPVCPYAKQARLRKTYRILECHNFAQFQDKIIEGAKLAKDPDVQIVIVGQVVEVAPLKAAYLKETTRLQLRMG